MKKLLFGAAFAVAGLFSTADAQLQKGNWMVGSDLMGIKFTNGFTMNLNPKAAYFIQDRWAVGAEVNLGIVSGGSTTWKIAPMTRYYFSSNEVDNLLKNGAFFAEANAGFGGSNIKGGATTNGVNLGIGAGYAYFITNNVSVEGLLKFDTYVGGGNSTSNGDLNLGVGFNIYLPSGKLKAAAKDAQ